MTSSQVAASGNAANTRNRKPSPRPKTSRRKLFDLHSWVGFQLAAFMTLVVATGTFAVVSDEIDWLVHPELRASTDAPPKGWLDIEHAFRAYAPEHALLSLGRHEGTYLTYRAGMIDPDGRRYFLYVDPATAEVTGETSTLTVQRFLRDLHRYLFMPSVIGLPLVTTMAVVLLISLYTGLKTIRNWRTVATRIRTGRGLRVAIGDSHKLTGLWSIWFFVLIVATSFWYFAELVGALSGTRFEPPRPGIAAERAAALRPVEPMADAATLVAAAETAFPGFQASSVAFAILPQMAATVLGRHNDPLVRDRANRVFLDPFSAEVIKVQRSASIDSIAYLNELADPLHFGSFGGLITKLIWFLFGLAMLSLTLSGVWLTWKRLKTRSPTAAQWAAVPLFLIVGGFGVPYVKRYQDPTPFEFARTIQQGVDESLALRLRLEEDHRGALLGTFGLDLHSTLGRINLSQIDLMPLCEQCAERYSFKPRFVSQTVVVRDSLPAAALASARAAEIQLTFTSGEVTSVVLDLAKTDQRTVQRVASSRERQRRS